MESLAIALVAAVVAGAIGFAVGRSRGLASGTTVGVAQGRSEGRAEGLEAGRKEGSEAGRAAGLVEGRKAGEAEGRRAGEEAGRKAGLEQGRKDGRSSGLQEGREQGRKDGFDEGVTVGREEGRKEVSGEVRAVEREAAMLEAISRVSAYLTRTVRTPLAEVSPESDADELRERIERALGALQDLDFFIEEIGERREGTDLVTLAQSVARDFAADQEIAVRISLGAPTVHADVNPSALMDALYLVLHNAGRFGGGGTIYLSVLEESGAAVVRVRDRGEGFSEEAFQRAFDPFYSTSDDGLGLGLPHARRAIESMGGAIELRNVPDGGAEVEVSFPRR